VAPDLRWHPAPVDGRDPTRVVTRRCIAILIDALLVAVIPLVSVLVIGHARSVRECPDPLPKGRTCVAWKNTGILVENRAVVVFFGFLVLLYVVVFVIVQGRTGASPGKALLGLRVVRPDGTRSGVLRSLVRALCWVIDGISILLPIALWTAWFTPGHRRVGDFAAGTFVVRAGTEHRLGAVPEPRPASHPGPGTTQGG
jgi:uncharacterized RDD family membrane protein YckC